MRSSLFLLLFFVSICGSSNARAVEAIPSSDPLSGTTEFGRQTHAQDDDLGSPEFAPGEAEFDALLNEVYLSILEEEEGEVTSTSGSESPHEVPSDVSSNIPSESFSEFPSEFQRIVGEEENGGRAGIERKDLDPSSVLGDRVSGKKHPRSGENPYFYGPLGFSLDHYPGLAAQIGDETDHLYVCSYCSPRFPFGNKLVIHNMIGEGQNDFSCELCEENFACSTAFHEHFMNTHWKCYQTSEPSFEHYEL